MKEMQQIRLSGFGGQGVVLAGTLLGEAGVMDGKVVAGLNSYGAQARGSGCQAEIVLSEGPIDFPHVRTADILVAMSQGGYDLFYQNVKELSGLILYDQGQVITKEGLNVRQIGIPASQSALKKLKNKQVANIVFLGALIEITKIVSVKAMQKAIGAHVSERFKDLNLKALQLGLTLGKGVHCG
jgi:2-oxoglutarate ferredoxin oxidoreductase subunit gamma